jgi:hypothetical protein
VAQKIDENHFPGIYLFFKKIAKNHFHENCGAAERAFPGNWQTPAGANPPGGAPSTWWKHPLQSHWRVHIKARGGGPTVNTGATNGMDPASLRNGLDKTGEDGNFDHQREARRVQQ